MREASLSDQLNLAAWSAGVCKPSLRRGCTSQPCPAAVSKPQLCHVVSAGAFQCPSCSHSRLGADGGGVMAVFTFPFAWSHRDTNSRSCQCCTWSAQFTAFFHRELSFLKEISTRVFSMFGKHEPCRSVSPLRICISCPNTYFSFVGLVSV